MGRKQEEAHRAEIKAMEAHQPPGSGCVVRCESAYVEDNSHSHRWNAAEQARAEPQVYDLPMDEPWRIVGWGIEKLTALKRRGGLAGEIGKDAKGRNVASLKPFYRRFIPFPHNAHHIIPVSVLWRDVIDKAVAKAEDDPGTMFNLVVGGLLQEPYNHNDRPNMITLPTRVEESRKLGLPMHLQGKCRDHPNYSEVVSAHVRAKVPRKYDQLAQALNDKQHPDSEASVQVKKMLVAISETTYDAIISLARTSAAANKTLDEVAAEIATDLCANLPRRLAAL